MDNMTTTIGATKLLTDQPGTVRASVLLNSDSAVSNPLIEVTTYPSINKIYEVLGLTRDYFLLECFLIQIANGAGLYGYTFLMKFGKASTKLRDVVGPPGPTGPTGPTGPIGPQGPEGTVAELDGDTTGDPGSNTVVKIQNRSVADTAPSDGNALVWSAAGSQWEPGAGGGGSITLGGDLADWMPTPDDEHQRVVGFNTVSIPHPELPTHRDLLQAQSELLLSDSPFDITSDGTGVWVGDIQSPASANYGGLVNVLFPDEIITTRFEYDAAGLGLGGDVQIWSVCHLNGYIYVTGLVGSSAYLARLSKVDGSFNPVNADGWGAIPYMAYVRTDGTYLYLMAPHPSKNNPAFFWVDPADLTTQTPFDPFPANYNPGVIGFAYDPVLGNVWLSAMDHDEILVVDASTHATAFTVATVAQPSDSVYAGGFVWVLQGSDLDYGANYTPGHPYNQYYVSYGVYTYTSSLAWLDPTDGSLLGTVSDPNSLIVGAIRMEYDSTNGCIWVVCDSPAPFAPGSPPTPLGPRLVRVDVATQTITGWCSLDVSFNMGIAVGGGYVWVVDSPAGDPGAAPAETILKIDPAEVGNPAVVPGTTAPGIIARITGGSIAYQFIKKNQDIVKVDTNLFATVTVLSEQETVLVRGSSTVNLPTSPVDGERHTIVDYNQDIGYFVNIIVLGWNGYSVATVAEISTAGGSVTVIWSATLDKWVVI